MPDHEDAQERVPTVKRPTRRKRKRLHRRVQAFHMRSQGYTGSAARRWLQTVERSRRRSKGFTTAQLEEAYGWGFAPELVESFGITPGNRHDFISLRDYLFARPFNGKYAKWVSDRISAALVFEPFRELFDDIHYQISSYQRVLRISPISPDARAAGTAIDGLVNLVSTHTTLVLAPARWTSRAGFQLRYSDGTFFIDDVPHDKDEFEDFLLKLSRRERFVVLKPSARVETPAPDALRIDVTMMNPHGDQPQVAELRVVHDLEREQVEDEPDDDEWIPRYLTSQADRTTGAFEGARGLVDGKLEHYADNPETGQRIAGTIPGWERISDTLIRMCAFAPQLKFLEFSVLADSDGFLIVRTTPVPRYSRVYPFRPDVVKFLHQLVAEEQKRTAGVLTRSRRGLRNTKLKVRREFAKTFFPRGLVPYQSVRWLGDMRRDFMQPNGITTRKKLWAYRHGFLSYRLEQYGITENNWEQFISDFEYRWLRHINDLYRFWLEDKVSIKYVASEFNDYLPGYYFYTSRSGDANHVVPMMDCPEGYGADYEEILRLARDRGVLALKPDEGSHGEGFYRLEWDGSTYSLNGQPTSPKDIVDLLANPKNQYLVTEFIEMHPDLALIYPHSVNTIRMIVFKKDGVTPQLGNTYLRIGSVASGYVDNTAAGGMLAEIDPATGQFGSAKRLDNGRVVSCPRHPDTGELIEGVIPNWEFTKQQILKMASNLTQLEYFGFDVAITPDGFKIPEINRFPDFPRIDKFTPETIDYLLHKLDQKKRRYGYDKHRPMKLVRLPKRRSS